MDITEEILKNKKYREQFDRFDKKTLILIANDHMAALEAAKKGIKQNEPEKANDVDYLELMAKEMQKVAEKILGERD